MFQKLKERSILKKIHSFREIDGWLTDQEALGLYLVASKLTPNATVIHYG